jgi:arylsulfatase A-like enzyme
MVGLWIGLVAGLVEVLIRSVQHFLLGKLLFVGADFWWGAPLVSAVLIAVPSILIGVPLARVAGRFGPQIRYGIPLFLAGFGLLVLVPQVAKPALAVLAAGIAVQGGRVLARHAVGFELLVRRTVLVLLLLPIALWAMGYGLRAISSARETHAVSADRPNVLLLVLDTVRAIELGLYGFRPTTSPNLDATGAQGVVFDQAFSTAPWTAPSHAGLFTGHRSTELSIDWTKRLDGSFPTLAEALRTRGYATAGLVANTEYASAETGLSRGFEHYEDYQLSATQVWRWTGLARFISGLIPALRHERDSEQPDRIGAADINRRFLRWLDAHAGRPFFGFLNYFDAHAPYFPPEPFWSRYLPGEPRQPHLVRPGNWSPQAVIMGRRAYEGGIAALDEQIGALLDSLRARRLLRATLLVIVGDHGEEFFEHGVMGHGNSLYAPSVRVPLLWVWPGHIPVGVRVSAPVSLASVPATILDLLGTSGPFPGPSLAGYWSGSPPAQVAVTSAVSFARNLPKSYPVSSGGLVSVRLGRYRWVSSPRDTLGELYDHEKDPFEAQNLARAAWAAPLLRALRDSAKVLLSRKGR